MTATLTPHRDGWLTDRGLFITERLDGRFDVWVSVEAYAHARDLPQAFVARCDTLADAARIAK